MSYDEQIYHRQRAEQCRTLAEHSSDPEVRKRHQELAQLHAGLALSVSTAAEAGDGVTAA